MRIDDGAVNARFMELLPRIKLHIYRIHRLHNPMMDREDALQDACVRVLTSLHNGGWDASKASESQWLRNLMRWSYTDSQRKESLCKVMVTRQDGHLKRVYAERVDTFVEPSIDEEDALMDKLEREERMALVLQAANSALAPRYRNVFRRVCVKGESQSSVAQDMKVTPARISHIAKRCVEVLREEVGA